MTLDKAIEIGKRYLAEGYIMSRQDFHEFIAMGIGALERVKLHRTDRRYPFDTLLPRETSEEEKRR